MEYIDINKNLQDGKNTGGLKQLVYFGLWDDVETFPALPSAPATLEAGAEITADLIMKTGKNMFSMYLTDDTGEFSIEQIGETDGKSYLTKLSLFHPGLQKKILGFMNATKNENLVLIVPDADGQNYLMGDALRPATMSGSPDGAGTTKETAGRKGVSMEFTYKTGDVYVYDGAIPLTPAA